MDLPSHGTGHHFGDENSRQHCAQRRLNRKSVLNGKEKDTIVKHRTTPPESDDLKDLVKVSLDDDKAQNVSVIELRGKTSFADFMVIASGTSQRHVMTMAEHLREKMKSNGLKSVGLEGMSQGDWVLLDGGDVIVHLFRPEVRAFYDLEKIWSDPVPKPGQVA